MNFLNNLSDCIEFNNYKSNMKKLVTMFQDYDIKYKTILKLIIIDYKY